MKIIFISLILIFLFYISAEGSDWGYVCTGLEGNKWYVDKDSIKHKSKNMVRAWIKGICLKDCEFGSKHRTEIKDYEEHDCLKSRWRYFQLDTYYTDGTDEDVKGLSGWYPVIPNSGHECIHKYLCKER